MNQTNMHLKSKVDEVNNFLRAHNNPPVDLFEELLLELSVSRLYLPGSFGGEEFSFEHLESEEGLMLLPLYTSPEQYSGDSDLESFEEVLRQSTTSTIDIRTTLLTHLNALQTYLDKP